MYHSIKTTLLDNKYKWYSDFTHTFYNFIASKERETYYGRPIAQDLQFVFKHSVPWMNAKYMYNFLAYPVPSSLHFEEVTWQI